MSCNFIFCLHNHQPIGNFDHIFEWAYKDCYNETIEILKDYPEFRFAVHHSGPLLEWISEHHPEYLHNIRMMSERGQVEVIGGGFYEPIFSIISEDDIKGQIKMMQDFCHDEFGKSPVGFWTAERVWDPDIPQLVSGFNLEYTILDDIHFRYAGVPAEKLYGYFLVERLDRKLGVYPIDKFLRYSIPFKLPEETVHYFRERFDTLGDIAFVYGDDGEKFGLWPDTYQWVFNERWLRNFVEAILREDWIKMTLPSEYKASHPPVDRVYLTQGSYFELSEWALPPKAAVKLININKEINEWHREGDFYPFLKGGVWNNFLNKYPESNAINKRTLLLSKEIARYEAEHNRECSIEKKELYKGECNCAYWHGLFGGVYLGNLRHALHEHVLKSEKHLLERKGTNEIHLLEEDFWNEGQNQILIRKKDQSVVLVPFLGGTMSEFGIYKYAFNICNVVQRRYEAYHDVLNEFDDNEMDNPGEAKSIHDRVTVKEKGLHKYLVFDRSRRYSFKDVIMNEIPTSEDLMFGAADVYDCGLLKYDYDLIHEKDDTTVSLSRIIDFENDRISLLKKFQITNDLLGIRAEYNITSVKNPYFGVELNINLLGGHDEDRFYEIENLAREDAYLDSIGTSEQVNRFALVDGHFNFKISCRISQEVTLLRYPVYTVSQSDSGFEKNFQGSSLLLIFKLEEGVTRFHIKVSVE